MFGKFRIPILSVLIGMLTACNSPKEDAIVGAAAIAELAQAQNVRPTDINVENVSFDDARHARVMAVRHFPDARVPRTTTFDCNASKADGRWTVKCSERPTP